MNALPVRVYVVYVRVCRLGTICCGVSVGSHGGNSEILFTVFSQKNVSS